MFGLNLVNKLTTTKFIHMSNSLNASPPASTIQQSLRNPYRPGAGHRPPYVAGREREQKDIETYFDQDSILCNIVLTGLRGVGKTVLLDQLRQPAQDRKWFWVATDLSESASVSEDSLSTRLLADLSVVTSAFQFQEKIQAGPGFTTTTSHIIRRLDYSFLKGISLEGL